LAGLIGLRILWFAVKLLTALTPVSVAGPRAVGLDRALREASDYLNEKVPRGTALCILNVQSDHPLLAAYVMDALTDNAARDGVFTVVDRPAPEGGFQPSAEVSGAMARTIGRQLGAETVVSGSVAAGAAWRLSLRALDARDGTVQGQFSWTIPNGNMTVTHPGLQTGAVVKVTNPAARKSVAVMVAKVKGAGGNKKIRFSREVLRALNIPEMGSAKLRLELLTPPSSDP